MGFLCPSPQAPATPDYAAAAKEQGVANKETAIQQGYLNNPNVKGPLGGQTVTFDPITNQPTINQTLTPQAQQTLDAQQRVQTGMASLGETGLNNARSIISTPFQYTGPAAKFDIKDPGAMQATPSLSTLEGYGKAGTVAGDKFGLASGALTAGQYGLAKGDVTGGQFGTAQGNVAGNQFGTAQGGVRGVNLQNSLDLSNVAKMPVNAGMTGQEAIMARLQPQLERQQKLNAQNLANQGLVAGGEAYTNQMRDQSMQQNDLLTQAALQGINLDLAANQQGFGQALAGGQFGNQSQLAGFGANLQNQQAFNAAIAQNYNQAMNSQQAGNQAIGQNFNQAMLAQDAYNRSVGQNFGQGLSAQQAANAAIAQNFGQGMQSQQMGNAAINQNQQLALQQQQIANAAQNQQYNQNLGQAQFSNNAALQNLGAQLQLRNQPLNEITGLMSGSQIQMPQFQGYNPTNIAPAPVFAGAQAQGAADMQRYGIQQSGANATTSGLFGVAGAAAPFIFSDRKLKTNIQRIGTHKLGIGLYEYDIFGERQHGVMADEAEKVMPEAVIQHSSGYKMVNYGLLNG